MLNTPLQVTYSVGTLVCSLKVFCERNFQVEPVLDGLFRQVIEPLPRGSREDKWEVPDHNIRSCACKIHRIEEILQPGVWFLNAIVLFEISGYLETFGDFLLTDARAKACWTDVKGSVCCVDGVDAAARVILRGLGVVSALRAAMRSM